MATLVLGTVGRALGGPLGGIAGTFVGSALDRGIFGSGTPREGARLANLAVQSAAYGEPIPRLYGRMRVAGNLVWTSGIRETRSRSGGGKRGPATNNYTYSASFAVVVAARPIVAIGRIWADGKLLRAGDGRLIYPAVIRTHLGNEGQAVDPLIAAAEGVGLAPAYRGRAYVVFDDLPLADYGNRIPNLTFEVIADTGDAVGLDAVVADLCDCVDFAPVISGSFPVVHGFAASRGGSARDALAPLIDIGDLAFGDRGNGLAIRTGGAAVPRVVRAVDLGATSDAAMMPLRHDSRAAAGSIPDAITIGFADPARDFQSGLQRGVRRTPVVRAERRDFDVALDAVAAKRLAETLLRTAIARRTTATLSLPWRCAAIRPGDAVRVGEEAEVWRVREVTLVGAIVELAVERVPATAAAVGRAADAGRVFVADDAPAGKTILAVLDLPALSGTVPTTPRLWLAAAGSESGWRRADIFVSNDDGDGYSFAATVDGGATMGTTATALPPGNCDRWDRINAVEVVVLNDAMWLESRSEAAVLAGANLALVGNEIIQFASAAAVGPRRFRLSTLLRGRRGTEAEAREHAMGDRFIMLDPDQLVAFDPAVEGIGAQLWFKAAGSGEDLSMVVATDLTVVGNALRPLAPVGVTVTRTTGGDLEIGWVRRSRAGFAWIDGIDAPLDEPVERFRVTAALDGRLVREVIVEASRWAYRAAEFASDGGASASRIDIAVAQVGSSAGVGRSVVQTIDLAAL